MDNGRLKEDLVEAGKFGRNPARRVEKYDQLDPKQGVTRPDGTEANKEIRDYTVTRMRDAQLKVEIDRLGNIFGRKEGSKTNKGVVMSGSHLDSVVNGGMFDGALGVFGAIEAIRRINDENFDNERPIEIAAFTAEDGGAFSPPLLASSTLVGKFTMDEALCRKNTMGKTLQEALQFVGYNGSIDKNLEDIGYFVEMHIEQGPLLDQEGISVGIVEKICGSQLILVTILGEENHAGTTPMKMRKDALVTASDIISLVNKRAQEMAAKPYGSIVGTVGKLNVFPNVTNTIPGKVQMSIDIRDVTQENMESLRDEIISAFKDIGQKHGCVIFTEVQPMNISTPLSTEIQNVIDDSAQKLGIVTRRINSGAGHDAQNMAKKVKTGMIFVPSVKGISHAPMEWTNWEDIEKGVKVLTQTLKKLSRL